MERHILSFEEFKKNDPHKAEKGEHSLVKKHYSGSTTKADTLEDPKDAEEKGGKVDHTEVLKTDDLSDPKNTKS